MQALRRQSWCAIPISDLHKGLRGRVDRARGLTVVSLSNTLYEGLKGQYTIDLRDAVYGAG